MAGALAARGRHAAAGPDGGRRAGRRDPGGRGHAARLPGVLPDRDRIQRPHRSHVRRRRRQRAVGPPAPPGCRRPGTAHCLLQRGESPARPRPGPAEGAGHPRGGGRQPGTGHPTVDGGERRARAGRRHGRPRRRVGRTARPARPRAGITASRGVDWHRRHGPLVYARRLPRNRSRLRADPRAARHPCQPSGPPEGTDGDGARRWEVAPKRPRRGGGHLGGRGPGGRRPAGPEFLAAAAPGSRVPH